MTQSVVSRPSITVAGELTERCDRCGAAGKLNVVLTGGLELTFCGHHANRYAPGIGGAAERITVESGFGWRGAE
jgi:hypothetical protein